MTTNTLTPSLTDLDDRTPEEIEWDRTVGADINREWERQRFYRENGYYPEECW